MARTKNQKATKEVIEVQMARNFTTFEYEGALKAMRAIKEMDPKLSHPTLRERYVQFQQTVQVAEAQMKGDVLAD